MAIFSHQRANDLPPVVSRSFSKLSRPSSSLPFEPNFQLLAAAIGSRNCNFTCRHFLFMEIRLELHLWLRLSTHHKLESLVVAVRGLQSDATWNWSEKSYGQDERSGFSMPLKLHLIDCSRISALRTRPSRETGISIERKGCALV